MIPHQLWQLSYYWSTGQSVRGKLLSYINALCSVELMKNTGGPSHPSSSFPKMQSLSHPSTQGHQPVHPDCPLACVHLRDGPECPPNQLALVLICLHWVCSRDPQHAKIRQRFQPSILICQERWLWGSGCNSWYQGQSILPGLRASQNVRDDAIGLSSICQISLGVQDLDSHLIMRILSVHLSGQRFMMWFN